ncbi:MAG: enoyl-CoA hydratase/isomerase family protein [Alphaproteobacteria bacterium]|nr:enoyl-CoA hydratase/isomerase family protein [Alphaproteobacteria bacterium]MBV9370612.1 enoyl-CoA hydratase/isomerase family protein [Alphaproteobacteria bacterium]MBV9900166.1 enoyl-CoA hydratase/isomerase family protein [Alphaproteobacteria bacterium]
MFDLSLEGGAARLILNRPEARNAIPADAWRGLGDTARAAAAAGAGLLVVEGAGSAFCAGADLSDFAAMRGAPERVAEFRLAMREGLDALAALPIPTIARVEGPCFGAGVALALACDLRLAGPAASFAITPAKLGISYPQEDVHRLVALVGPGQASRLLLTALPVGAAEAHRIGLAELCMEDMEAELARLCAAILAGHRESHASLKRAVALAARGVVADPEQDRAFDALIVSETEG